MCVYCQTVEIDYVQKENCSTLYGAARNIHGIEGISRIRKVLATIVCTHLTRSCSGLAIISAAVRLALTGSSAAGCH